MYCKSNDGYSVQPSKRGCNQHKWCCHEPALLDAVSKRVWTETASVDLLRGAYELKWRRNQDQQALIRGMVHESGINQPDMDTD